MKTKEKRAVILFVIVLIALLNLIINVHQYKKQRSYNKELIQLNNDFNKLLDTALLALNFKAECLRHIKGLLERESEIIDIVEQQSVLVFTVIKLCTDTNKPSNIYLDTCIIRKDIKEDYTYSNKN